MQRHRKTPKQSLEQKAILSRVMREFKRGALPKGKSGQTVKSRKQAIAVALSEAGASNRRGPSENRRRLARTKTSQSKAPEAGARRAQEPTRQELYARAQKAGIHGRSRMNKSQLRRALARR